MQYVITDNSDCFFFVLREYVECLCSASGGGGTDLQAANVAFENFMFEWNE